MITKLTIEGFKAIREATLELDEFTLLIGRNGSGKSSVLEALEWLRDAARMGLEEATNARYRAFGDVLNRRCSKLHLDTLFEQREQKPAHYTLSVRQGTKNTGLRPIVDEESCRTGRTRAAKVEISSRKGRGPGAPFRWIAARKGRPWVINSGDELALGSAPGRAPGAGALFEFLTRAVFLRLSPTAMATEVRERTRGGKAALAEDGADLPLLIERLDTKSKHALVRRIQKIFPSVRGVEVSGTEGRKHLVVRERMIARGGTREHEIPAWLLSEGMRRIVAIFSLLETRPRPPLLAIEEIENGLDPWTLEHVLGELRQAARDGTQIVLTTHSPFFLDHIDPRDVIHVQRKKGESKYVPVHRMKEAERFAGVLTTGAMYLQKLFGDERVSTDASSD